MRPLRLLAAVLVLCASSAHAQSAPRDAASAEALFLDGKKLLEEGRFEEACAKLAESQRLDPGTGTLMALALCNERAGHTATAWAQFSEALAAAKQAGRRDRVAEAQKHVDALAPKLSKLRVLVPPELADVAGLEVLRDGIALGKPSWGSAAPVDPGDHTVVARAPGKVEWAAAVRVGPNADEQRVTVGPLVDARTTPAGPPTPAPYAPAIAPPPPPGAPDPGATQRTVGWIVAGVGLAGVGVGAVFGGLAVDMGSQANARCPSSPCADADAVAKNADAHAMANVANVAIIGGALAMATGIVLVLTAPKQRSSLAILPSAQGARMHLVIRF